MKKKLTGCLIGCLLVLLFMTTPAFAHIKADGTKCQSEGYDSFLGSENQTETQHECSAEHARRSCGKTIGESPTINLPAKSR